MTNPSPLPAFLLQARLRSVGQNWARGCAGLSTSGVRDTVWLRFWTEAASGDAPFCSAFSEAVVPVEGTLNELRALVTRRSLGEGV
jgi:hypothetical protein